MDTNTSNDMEGERKGTYFIVIRPTPARSPRIENNCQYSVRFSLLPAYSWLAIPATSSIRSTDTRDALALASRALRLPVTAPLRESAAKLYDWPRPLGRARNEPQCAAGRHGFPSSVTTYTPALGAAFIFSSSFTGDKQ